MCLNKKNTWTTSPCKTWESWIICIIFSTNSTLQMFLLSSFRHSELLNNIPGFGKWASLNIILENCIYIYIYIYIYIFIWFHFTFHDYFCKKFYHSWVVENNSYKICQLEFCEFQVVMFSEKNTFLLLLIFSVKAL